MTPQVYFAAHGGRIKIGTTKRLVEDRMRQIGAHLSEAPVLLGNIDGGLPLERAIHAHLQEYRLRGEWFRDCDETRRAIRNLVLGGPKAIGFTDDIFIQRPVWHPNAPTTPQPRLPLIQLVAFIWPDDPVTNLSEFSGEPIERCQAWLDETEKPSKLLAPALCYELWQRVTLGRGAFAGQ